MTGQYPRTYDSSLTNRWRVRELLSHIDSDPLHFHSVRSAKRELLLFLVVYVFTQHATTDQAPIEVIMPAARSMPLYRLINDPFRALQEREDVKREAEMADLLRPQAAAA